MEAFIEAEIKHRLAMSQLSQSNGQPATQSLDQAPEPATPPLPFVEREDYLESYNTLEKMVLHEIAQQQTHRNEEDK